MNSTYFFGRVSVLFVLATFGTLSTPAMAQRLDKAALQAVTKWFRLDAAKRGSVDRLNLPNGLSATRAKQTLESLWQVYRDTHYDKELGELPLSLNDLHPDQEAETPGSGVRLSGAVNSRTGSLTLTKELTQITDMQMRYYVLRKERRPITSGKRSLFICTHGSGPTAQEWSAQIRLATQLYRPDGIYFVPRMPKRSGKRWIRGYNQDTYERVIAHAVAYWGVDPNRVYFLGISQGGFATDKLLPHMPDRFAAGNAMASGVNPHGHPPQNLRNTAYRTDVGERDTQFNRVGNAILFHKQLDELAAKDPGAYTHSINVQEGRGHGINYQPGVTWISKHRRNAWPNKVVWIGQEFQQRRRTRHYWIGIAGSVPGYRSMITAEADRKHNTITITARLQANKTKAKSDEVPVIVPLTGVSVRLLLHDELLDLDKPITVTCNGKEVFAGKVKRSAATQLKTLAEYKDPVMVATAEILIPLAPAKAAESDD